MIPLIVPDESCKINEGNEWRNNFSHEVGRNSHLMVRGGNHQKLGRSLGKYTTVFFGKCNERGNRDKVSHFRCKVNAKNNQ